MPVGIVEVMNNTGGILHYTNQESGYKFDLNPTSKTYGDGGYISTSKYKDDTVPYKSSGRKIIVTIDGGRQFSLCDDYYKFSIIGNSEAEKWTGSFGNGSRFVMKVDDDDVKFVPYDDGLRANDAGYVAIGGFSTAADAIGNAVLAVYF